MHYLITGGAGYIGSVLTNELLKKGNKVTVLDNLMYRQTSLMNLCREKNFTFIHGDVRDVTLLKQLVSEADCIIPLAALVGVDACKRDSVAARAINAMQVRTILEVKSQSQQLAYPNTNSGYGSETAGTTFCTEETPLKPISWYGAIKCEAEDMVLDNGGVSLRLATVFGISPRMRLDLLVNNFTYKALTDGYLVLFEQHFKRNYIHVMDVVQAFEKTIGKNEIYNVGLSSANLSKHELALKIKEHVPNLSIQFDEFNKDKDQRNYIVSNEKIEKLGWKPEYSLDDGIKEIMKALPMLASRQQEFSNL